jgi:high-affinity iron transporter
MFTIDLLPGFIMGIREGLEAFLIIAIMLEYLNKSKRTNQKRYVFYGLGYGVIASLVFGMILYGITSYLGGSSAQVAKLWESIASLIALLLITSFIYFMLQNKDKLVGELHNKMGLTLSNTGLILLAFVMVVREGVEIVLFTFAAIDQGPYIIGTIFGIALSGIITFGIYKSMFKVNLKLIFNITLVYLILQAGFLFGYSIHELLSYFKDIEVIDSSHFIYTKLFDLSHTILYHKEQPLGIALYALIGWYSKPEVIQFIVQYTYTITFLVLFVQSKK